MADTDSTNTRATSQLTAEALTALSGRLVSHAEGIENIAARPMAEDMRLAAQAIRLDRRALASCGRAHTTSFCSTSGCHSWMDGGSSAPSTASASRR